MWLQEGEVSREDVTGKRKARDVWSVMARHAFVSELSRGGRLSSPSDEGRLSNQRFRWGSVLVSSLSIVVYSFVLLQL